eukprot:COSAG01_NODE_40731_length_460_cov_0.864266_2_plen_29_part_01
MCAVVPRACVGYNWSGELVLVLVLGRCDV